MIAPNPGPWKLGEEREYDSGCAPHGYRMVYGGKGSGPVARVYETGTQTPSGQPVGNALLIAAAPDLLAALTAAAHALKSYAHGNASTELAEEVAAACDAAIAKATGA